MRRIALAVVLSVVAGACGGASKTTAPSPTSLSTALPSTTAAPTTSIAPAEAAAQIRAAQSSLRKALTAAEVVYTDNNSYSAADESTNGLRTIEPSLTYVAHNVPSTGAQVVSVHAEAGQWSGAALAHPGACYFIRDVPSDRATTYGMTTTPA